ncbi:MAG: argininosuccinate lyase [Verrucomicrobiales bacterium]|nr:argininosuccinate lyase [Verrucomicrobiales bacterium]|tara:strand:- start:2199 stop:3608 length:1410 start_codon:yes stop_codon:yes gene_type:complete
MAKSTKKIVARSGRFAKAAAREANVFTASVGFDYRLAPYDIAGSIAHARMLHHVGLLKKKELAAIEKGLEAIGREIEAGKFKWRRELEDVHMNIEAALTRKTAAGAKLHTGRSRNDQVAVDTRMWLRDEICELANEIHNLQLALIELAENNLEVVIPGYTHLQRAQPVYLAHHLLAYVEMFERDYERLLDCLVRVNVCPLGSGAIAGTTLPLDREFVARELGFVDAHDQPMVTQNSMDAVADRDYIIEFCAVTALLAAHQSRLCEDLVLWSSAEFGFIEIGDAYTTGSSLMPQKKNPDICELVRGKSGRVAGNLVALLTTLKGLPLTYNSDLQEDKERLFDSCDTARNTTRILAAMLRDTAVNEAACAKAADDPNLLATDLVDWLVEQGTPFRDAHHVVGAVVALAEKKRKRLDKLTAAELKKADKRLTREALQVFDLKTALDRRTAIGAPGTAEVKRRLAHWHKFLRH